MLSLGTIIANIKKGQSAVKVRDILSNLESNYQKIKPNIAITGCKKEASKITIYTTTPSSSTPGVVYDTVLELHTSDKLNVNTQFKVYSNSPSFAYSFSYVFNQQGSLLWPQKYPAEFKKISPKTRNPFMFTGFSKDVYSSIRYVADYGISRIIGEFDGTIPPVKSFQEKIKEITDIKNELERSRL